MRTSRPDFSIEEVVQEVIDSGKEIIVRDYAGRKNLKVRSLKKLNRTAYDSHLVELEIDEKRVRVNIEDLRNAIKYT